VHPETPALRKLRQENYEFEVSPRDIERFYTALSRELSQ
jgi:hypothetical protein